MSSTAGDLELVTLVSSATLSARVGISTIALLAFDYVATLDKEVQLIWMRKKTPASLLFLIIRYHALVSQVFLNAVSFTMMSDNACSRYVKAQIGMEYAQFLTWAVFSGLRTMALSQMNWYLGTLVFFLASAPFIVNMWAVSYGIVGFELPIVGCVGSVSVPTHAAHIGTILSRACTIAADLIIVIISWRYAAQGFGWRLRRMPTLPLTRVMILNGSAYFLALLVLNALHLTLTMLSIVGLSEPASDVTEFTDPLTAILICRFLFALHAANLKSSAVSVDLYMNTSLNLDDTRPRIVGAFSALHYDADLGAQARSADPERTLQFASLVVESMGGAVGDEWDADELELELDADVEQGTSATEVDSASEGGPEQVSSGTTVWKNRR